MSHPKPDLENIFSYHAPNPEQLVHYKAVREGALAFAKVLEAHVPDGADKSAALRELRVCVMTANAAIALDGKI
jgi:hypothetical protein